MLARVGPEATKHDALDRRRLGKRRKHSAKRDARGAVRREAVGAGRDRWVSNRDKAVFVREREAAAVAGGEEPVLAPLASAPDRTDGVNHVTRRQAEARRDLGISRLAAAKLDTGRAEFRPCSAMDRAVDPATAEQSPVGGVDDGIDLEPGDVALDDLDTVPHGSIADGIERRIN
jgi:hypothetical protein